MSPSSNIEAESNRRGGRLYLIATIVAQVVALLRYISLARLLGPEQLGLAATLVVTAAFFDQISDTGSDRFLIQDREGDSVKVQHLVQFVSAGRGILIAIGLSLLSWPISMFYKAPQLIPGIIVLGASPLLLGFMHLDVRRYQRTSDFRSEAIMILVAEPASLMATVAAAWVTHSFMAILFGLITRAALMTIVSHIRAERSYRVAYVPEHAPRLAQFAAPLMMSGLLLFIGSQGDRVLVGNRLGFAALGHYSAVLLLIFYPSAVIQRYMHIIYLPMVAAHRDDLRRRDQVSDRLAGQTFLLALAMAVGFAVVAPPMVGVFFGARFVQSATLVGLIGILQSTRFLINWPMTVAFSMGRSNIIMISNLARMLAYPGAFIGQAWIGGLQGIVCGFIIGELISIATGIALLNFTNDKPHLHGFDRFTAFLFTALLIVLSNFAVEYRSITSEIALGGASCLLAMWIIRREQATLLEAIAMVNRVVSRRTAR